MSWFDSKKIQNGLLIASSVIVLLVVLEIGANFWLKTFADEETYLKYAFVGDVISRYQEVGQIPYFEPHRYLGYTNSSNFKRGPNKHNSMGFRGEEFPLEKPEGEFRIVCMGGSTTYTEHVPDYRLSYPAQLEVALHDRGFKNVRVINAGVGGWSSWETMLNFMLRVVDLDPDMVIFYHGVNDIHSRLVYPLKAYQGDNSGRRAVFRGLLSPPLHEYSLLYRFFAVRFGLMASHNDLVTLIDKTPPTSRWREYTYQYATGTYPTGVFSQMTAAKIFENNTTVFFERNVRHIVDVAKARGIEVLLVTQAFNKMIALQPEYVAQMHVTNDTTRRVAANEGILLLDFEPDFPNGSTYYTDGYHNTPAGAKLKAQMFADHIAEHILKKKL